MLFEFISLILGVIKILIYKFIYPFRISFRKIPKMNKNFKIAIKRKSKLYLGERFRARNNVAFRVYNGGKIVIGDNCFMNDNCSVNCQSNIIIGNNVIFGPNVMIFDHDHDYKNNIQEFIRKEIVIGNNVWIGANVTILKGVRIGNNVVIGAGSIVRNDIGDNSVYYDEKKGVVKNAN